MAIGKYIFRPLCKLFHRKPKNFGEALRRVVKAAGNGEPATLVKAAPGERVYSNGVNIYSTNVLNQPIDANFVHDSATYVLKKPWTEGITADSIYALKGKTTFYFPDSKYKVKSGVSFDTVIGDVETSFKKYADGTTRKVPADKDFPTLLRDLYAEAFL